MIKKLFKKSYIFLLLAFLLVTDLVSKALICGGFLQVGESFDVAPGVFSFVYTQNDSAAMGMMDIGAVGLSVLVSLVCVAIIAVLVIKPNFPWSLKTALGLLLGGALGNLVDRIAFGFVRDFISYDFLDTVFGLNFPFVGNIADIFVLVGAVMLIFYVVFDFKECHFKGLRWKKESSK